MMSGATNGAVGTSSKGTPKIDVECHVCDDWGTVLVKADDGRDVMELCPTECEAAQKFEHLQTMAMPRHWLRKCNGASPGALVGQSEAEFAAGQPGVTGSLKSGLAWTVGDPGGKRHFTLTPMSRKQAGDWLIEQQRSRPPRTAG
jgi:hypothetical protein